MAFIIQATGYLRRSAILFQGSNATDFQYCEDRSLNMLQLARLGRKLSTAGKISIVYTYSSAAAGAMKLLSSLILGGKIEGKIPFKGSLNEFLGAFVPYLHKKIIPYNLHLYKIKLLKKIIIEGHFIRDQTRIKEYVLFAA